MAMRPQATGGRYRRPLRRVYEDFEPTTKCLEENEVTLLQLFLPGFKREQINTCDEASRFTYPRVREIPARITIKGERPLGNNKWSRFSKTLDIPGNCDATGIQTKLEDGTCTITIPKKRVATRASLPGEATRPSQEPPSSRDTMAQPKLQNRVGKAQDSSTSSSDEKKHEEAKLAELSSPQKTIIGSKVLQGQEDTPHKLSSALTDDSGKKIDKRKVVSAEKGYNGKMIGKKQRSEEELKHPDENVAGTSASAKMKQTGEGSKESNSNANPVVRDLEEMEAMIAALRKHTMKPLAISRKEEKQLFVNMGVALAVIMALGAHIAITFWT